MNSVLDFAPERRRRSSPCEARKQSPRRKEAGEGAGTPESDWSENAKASHSTKASTPFSTCVTDEGISAAPTLRLWGQWKSMPGAAPIPGRVTTLDDFVEADNLRVHLSQQVPSHSGGVGPHDCARPHGPGR